ncbi:MAG: hypothetical protein WDM85_04380 [Caulobacteraceae bacterium]
MIEFSGVRSSWLTMRRNERFWASIARRAAVGSGWIGGSKSGARDVTWDIALPASQFPHWTRS